MQPLVPVPLALYRLHFPSYVYPNGDNCRQTLSFSTSIFSRLPLLEELV